MILSLPTDTVLENYVQVSGMASTHWGDDWDPGECECGGPPPPAFMVPPPPRPPAFPPAPPLPYDVFGDPIEDCDGPFTCPALLGAREDHRPPTPRAPLAVVIVSAATLVVLVVVAAVIVCRLRGRGRSAKGCTELSGAIIYDDLPSAPSIVPARTRPRFKPVPLGDGEEVLGMTMGVHLYTPEPRSAPPSEHLYQSISSGSETCSYSTSEAPHDHRSLLRPPHPPRGALKSPAPPDISTDDEDEGVGVMAPPSDNDTPNTSPNRSRYYCPSAPSPNHHAPHRLSPASSDYESVYYVGGGARRERPLTPQERGLPPLPSRTDRFRIYFSVERGGHRRGGGRRRGSSTGGRRNPHIHHYPLHTHPRHHHHHPAEAEPLYENLT